MLKRRITILLFAICFFAHAKSQTPGFSDKKSNHQDNSQNSLDWPGIYYGVLPCADCEGIEVYIDLGKGLRFTKKVKYLGKSDELLESSGTFSWSTDGNQITLSGTGEIGSPEKYQVAENKIITLDEEGNRITGNLAGRYILGKVNTGLLEKYWKLTELEGRPITASAQFNREPHIIFKEKDNRVMGNGGCNNFSGAYTLRSNDRLALSKMITTLMACPQMDVEAEFLKVLQMADNYYVSGDTLVLNKARMAPLARFQAIYFK